MGRLVCMEEGRSVFKILPGKPTGKRPLGRPSRRLEDNIRVSIRGIVFFSAKKRDSLESTCECGIFSYWISFICH